LALLSRLFAWRSALVVVRPDTLIRWHRAGFRLFWRWKSRPGRPRIPKELRELIRRMALENPLWGQERIANELLVKLGLHVSPRTVRRYMPKPPAGRPRGDQRWSTFLKNHAQAIVACDFFVAVSSTFGLLYVLVVMEHRSRRLIHCNVTAHATAAWTRQQLREAFGLDARYGYLIHDRDSIFSRELDASVGRCGLRVLKTPPRCPMANGLCERLIRNDTPRVSGLAHTAIRSSSAACAAILGRTSQPRTPTHGPRSRRAGSSSSWSDIDSDASSSPR